MSVQKTREYVATQLAVALPLVDVVDYPRTPDQVSRRRVIVGIRDVAPPNVACPTRVIGLDVWCVSPLTGDGVADDDVDQLAQDVLDALDALGIRWQLCERGTFEQTNPAYRVDVDTYEVE